MIKVFLRYPFSSEEKDRFQKLSPDIFFQDKPDEETKIIIGSYRAEKLKEYPSLKWIQLSAVGYDRYIAKGILKEGVLLTNAVGVHTQEVAEHIFAVMLMMIKNEQLYRDNQHEHLWRDEGKVKSFGDLKVTIIGFGSIGNCLARMCKALNMRVTGVKRKPIEKPEYLDELYLNDELNQAISDADVVVSVLPGNKENEHLFDLDTFKAMREDSIFINAGRGNLYSEEVLTEVLDKKIIKAVSTDVFAKEPLPPESKLWDYPNLFITPHAAGNFHLKIAHEKFVELTEENLRRYISHEELKYLVTERE
ncbi:MAG: D-2-hydroxyacid dehydrogenase [Erysipelotrichaceae bacterium]|nr:D-2-hydroxyacid dehydrogenase [Erysipelotrichaceae bacterium]